MKNIEKKDDYGFLTGFFISGIVAFLLVIFFLIIDILLDDYIFMYDGIKMGFDFGFLLILISLYIGGVFLFEPIDFCECGCS